MKSEYLISSKSHKEIINSIREFYLSIFLGTPITWIFHGLLMFRIQLNTNDNSKLWFVFLFLLMLSSLLTIVLPLLAIQRFKKIAIGVILHSNKVKVKLYSGLEFEIIISDVKKSQIEFKILKDTFDAFVLSFNSKGDFFYLIPKLFPFGEDRDIKSIFDKHNSSNA